MTVEQNDYRRNLCFQYIGDEQGFLCAERDAMLSGHLPLALTHDHLAATKCQNDSFLASFNKTVGSF